MLFKGEVYSWIALVVTNKGKDGQVLATNGFSKGPGLISNNKFKIKKAQEFINGTNFSTIGKKVKVSRARGEYIISNPGYAGCYRYRVIGDGTSCNCAQFASRNYNHATGENLRVSYPVTLVRYIRSFNKSGEYTNGGRILN